MTQQVKDNVFLDRFISVLSAAFACLATLLAAVGLYGVLATPSRSDARDRAADGAWRGTVACWKMVLRQVAIMTLVGGAIGLGVDLAGQSRGLAPLRAEGPRHRRRRGGDRAERRGVGAGFLPARARPGSADARAPLRVATAFFFDWPGA